MYSLPRSDTVSHQNSVNESAGAKDETNRTLSVWTAKTREVTDITVSSKVKVVGIRLKDYRSANIISIKI